MSISQALISSIPGLKLIRLGLQWCRWRMIATATHASAMCSKSVRYRPRNGPAPDKNRHHRPPVTAMGREHRW